MRFFFGWGLALLIPLSHFAWSQDSSLETHLDLFSTSEFFTRSLGPSVNNVLEIIRVQPQAEEKWGSHWKFKLRPVLQADPINDSVSERYWGDLPEAYAQLRPLENGPSALGIQAGFNTFTWGVTDVFNPLDIVNARRYTDPLNWEKLGAPSLSVHGEIPGGLLSIDGIYIPFQRKTILPGVNSRWLPRETFQTQTEQFGSQLVTIVPPATLDYNYQDSQEVGNPLNGNFGFRIEGHVPSLDFSFVALDGAAPSPVTDLSLSGTVIEVDPSIVIAADPGIAITPVYYRQLMWGTSATYTLGEFIFRGEAAFTRGLSKRPDLPGLTNEFVLEIEHEFGINTGQLTAFLVGTSAQHSEPINPSFASLDRMFDRAIAPGFRYAPNSTLTGSALVFFDTEYHGQLLHLDVSDSLTDALKIGLVGDALFGPLYSPLGTYRKNERILLTLKYSI